MPAVSKKQQRFFGIVRAAQKGTLKGKKTLEVQRAASSMKKKDVKKFASTKHKGLPEKKVTKESFNEDYVKELEDGLVKMDYPTYDEVDELMKKIAKDNGIDTTVLHMAFKTKHLMVPDDWAKKKMFEPVMIPKTPKDMECEELNKDDKPFVKKLVGKLRKGSKTHAKQADDLEKAMVSEKRKISDMEKKLYNRQKPSSDMITARPGEAKKQGKLVDKYSKKYKTPTQKNETQKFLKGIARGEVHQEGSLHKWFKGSSSKDGKGGWVNVVTGGTCASDKPGEGTPKCVSSSKRASMSKSERQSAARRKKAADPGQQSKSGAAKPTYVSTDSPRKKVKKEEFEPLITEKCWAGYEKKGMKTMFGKRYPNCVKKKRKVSEEVKRDEYGDPIGGPKISKKQKEKNLKSNTPDEQHNTRMGEGFVWECWKTHKKVGMKMKGGKLVNDCRPKNESFEIDPKKHKEAQKKQKARNLAIGNKNPNEKATAEKKAGGPKLVGEAKNSAQQAAIAISKKNRLEDLKVAKKKKLTKESLDEKLVHGKFGNYIKNQKVDKAKEKPMKKPPYEVLAASYEPLIEAKKPVVKIKLKDPSKIKVKVTDIGAGGKEYVRKDEMQSEAAAWTRKAGKSESGGLNAKGVASYRAANPGSKLKTAVTTKPSKLKKGSKSAKRRLSFCRRMKGMKKKLTSAKTARDPDSRINKSLRKWNCSYEPEGNFIGEDYVKGGVRNNPSTTSTKKVSGMIKALQRKQSVLKQPMKAMDAGARGRRLLQRREHEKYVSPIIPDHLKDEYTPVIEEGKSAKKCKDGQYYCFNDKKCKPIPSGYRIGYGGMLRPENKEDDSNGKKGGSNGNGNGNGGNGNGHGGNGNGGNGGGNGGGE